MAVFDRGWKDISNSAVLLRGYMAKVLLIEDDPYSTKWLLDMLRGRGYEVAAASDGEQGIEAARRENFEVVVTDWKMPGVDGFDVINILHLVKPELPVILITGFLTPEIAVQAERLGAYACVLKWPQPPRVLDLLDNAAHQPLIGSSRLMQNICKDAGTVAGTDLTVMIQGKPGSGRKSLGQMIHRHSQRSGRPFVSVDCSTEAAQSEVPEAWSRYLEKRLEEAGNGTVVFQHVGRLGCKAQAKLLAVMPDGTIPQARILVTIEPDEHLRIREDLYHRLSEFHISIPPLREHPEDIPELVRDFVDRYADSRIMPDETLQYLKRQEWPGNVRQIRTVLDEAILLARGHTLTPNLFEQVFRERALDDFHLNGNA